MLISCFSFTEVAKRAAALMPNGGAMVTLTYGGSMRVQPNYNVMGVAKAALEASGALSRLRFRPAGGAGQRDLGRPGAHACRRRHLRRPHHVQLPAQELAAPPLGDARRDGQHRALPALRPRLGQ
jgi:hypothetical protein